MAQTTATSIAKAFAEAPLEQLPELIEIHIADPRKSVQTAVTRAIKRYEAYMKERERVAALYRYQASFGEPSIGVDEVGRGPLAGPLAVGAVVLPPEPQLLGLDDSKKLSPSCREELAAQIKEVALSWTVIYKEPQVIDEVGIGRALKDAMAEAIAATGFGDRAAAGLIDGNPVHVHPQEISIVKGDGRVAAIAAASIVAKVERDALMVAYDQQYPGYGFAHNKGYGSADHMAAIRQMGLTPLHRRSFCGRFL